MSRFFDELCSQLFEGKTPPSAAKMKQWGQTPMFHFEEKTPASTEKNETMGSDPDVSF